MRTRTVALLSTVLLGALLLTGVGVALAWAQSHNGLSQAETPGPMMGQAGHGPMMGQAGHGPMMGGSGQGPMMGPNGHGPMMGGSAGSTSQATAVTGVTQVRIVNFAFTPANIQVKAGTTVTWTNQDTAPHTVTFRNGMKDSGLLRQGQSFSYTFTSPGAYDYYCTVHPYMTAVVNVTS
jgi:amicyanin